MISILTSYCGLKLLVSPQAVSTTLRIIPSVVLTITG